jgi:hypothetical protein
MGAEYAPFSRAEETTTTSIFPLKNIAYFKSANPYPFICQQICPVKKAAFAALLLIACLNACVKDHCPPPPSSSGWLISKVTELRFRSTTSHTGDPESGNYQKTVHELQYNAVNKPILRRTYESPENDTLNLIHMYVDSLTYDAQNRIIEIRRHPVGDISVYGRRYIYPGNDTLPSVLIVYDSAGTSQMFTDTIQYRYYADKVTAYDKDDIFGGGIDSTEFYYTAGNLTATEFNNNGPLTEVTDYDSAHNVERYFNLQHGLVFPLAGNYRAQIRLSLNNWQHGAINGYDRTITYDNRGLVVELNAYSVGEKARIINRLEYTGRN